MKKILLSAVLFFVPFAFVSASTLECPVGEVVEHVLVTPGTEGTPAVTHVVHHEATSHTIVVTDVAAYDETIIDTPAYDETVTDSPAHYNYSYAGSNDGDYDVIANVHHTGDYDHTTGHTYMFAGFDQGDFDFVSATHHGDYNRVWVGATTHVVHHPAVTHVVHHNAVTHEETVVDTEAYDETVIDTPAVPGTDAIYEDQCVSDTEYTPPSGGSEESTPPTQPSNRHRLGGQSLNCKAVGKVFVNTAEFTGCQEATQSVGVTYPPTCVMLSSLASNGADYCQPTWPYYEQDWFRNAVIALYEKLVK